MNRRTAIRSGVLFLVLLGISASAQSLRLASVRITGSKRLPPDKVAAASGLRIGDSILLPDLQKAADRLAALGLFEHVTYQYQTMAETISVEFVVEETARFRPCEFDNFVWLPRDALLARLKQEIPLFTGEAPPGGYLTEQIVRVLEKLLAEQGIRARVIHLAAATDVGGINLFRVEGVSVPMTSIRFPGADQISEEDLQRASENLLDQDYSYAFLLGFTQGTLVALYHARGYLKVRFDRPQVEYLGEKAGAHPLRLTVPVAEGPSYRVREIRWEGNQVLSAMELANRVSLQAGAVANTVQLQRDLDTIRGEEYGGRGYILAQLRIVPELDDAARTADLVVQVNEGDQFRFQSLVIEGLPPTAVAELNRRWKLKPGEPYNNVYAEKFIREEVAAVVKRLSAQPLSLTYSLARDDEQSTVTVWIRFR